MNSFEEILQETDSLTDQCRTLIEEEMQQLRSGGGEPAEEFYARKRELIGHLEGNVQRLRNYRESLEEQPVQFKSQLDYLQQKFMQVLRLDRELEKLLLGSGFRNKVPCAGGPGAAGAAEGSGDPAAEGSVDPSRNPVNRAYGQK